MRELVTSHRFANGARLAVYFLQDEPHVPKDDHFLVRFTSIRRDGSNRSGGWYMRPDEAVLLIEKLAGALYKSAVGYTVQTPRKQRRHA